MLLTIVKAMVSTVTDLWTRTDSHNTVAVRSNMLQTSRFMLVPASWRITAKFTNAELCLRHRDTRD
jgi:hypothetical protein